MTDDVKKRRKRGRKMHVYIDQSGVLIGLEMMTAKKRDTVQSVERLSTKGI